MRSEIDRISLIEAVNDGTIDIIATDHAPHSFGDKLNTFDSAMAGINGAETALITLLELVDRKEIDLEKIIKGEKKFISNAFVASSMDDLEKISQADSFGDIEELSTPGGGYVSKGKDLDGFGVEVAFGIQELEKESAVTIPTNEGRKVGAERRKEGRNSARYEKKTGYDYLLENFR